MRTLVLSALALGAMTTAALAEPMALTDAQMDGITAGAGSGGHTTYAAGSFSGGGGCSRDGTHCGGGFHHVDDVDPYGGTQSGGGSCSTSGCTTSGTREVHYDDGTTEGDFVRSGHNVYDNTGAGRCVASGIYAGAC